MITLCAKSDGSECLLQQSSNGSTSGLLNDHCSTSLHSWLGMQDDWCISILPWLASEALALAIVFM